MIKLEIAWNALKRIIYEEKPEMVELIVSTISITSGLMLAICGLMPHYFKSSNWIIIPYNSFLWGVLLTIAGVSQLYGLLLEHRSCRLNAARVHSYLWGLFVINGIIEAFTHPTIASFFLLIFYSMTFTTSLWVHYRLSPVKALYLIPQRN